MQEIKIYSYTIEALQIDNIWEEIHGEKFSACSGFWRTI